MRKLTSVTDYMIVASGTSNRHVRALIEHVTEMTNEAGRTPIGVEGEDGGEWVLLDLDDALVHVMLPKVRDFSAAASIRMRSSFPMRLSFSS